MKKRVLFLLIVSIIALWPFFKKGFIQTHDGEWMIIRFTAFHQTLVSGQFPVRFVDRLANGFGYPVVNFLYPLPFYITEIFKLSGFGFITSIKITFILSTIASVVAMYWALRQIFSEEASIAGSVIYLFSPYRFVDIYVRGSIGENLAFTFLPLIFGAIYKIKNNKKIYLPLLSIFVGCLILSHNIIAFLFIPILFILGLLVSREKKELFLFYLGGIFLTSFFWLPALYDLRYVNFSQSSISNISEHLVNIYKLIIPNWGYGSSPNGIGGLSTQLGVVTLIVFCAVFIIALIKKRNNYLCNFMLILFLISASLMTNFSNVIWTSSPLGRLIQFPWRLLSIIVFCTAYLTAYLVESNKKRLILSALIIIASIISTIIYTKPTAFVDYPDSYYSTNEDTTTVQDEYLPIWVEKKSEKRAPSKVEVSSGQTKIDSLKILSSNYSFISESKQETKFRINSFYFPGWYVNANGQKVNIDYSTDGLINFSLPSGKYNVLVRYGEEGVHLLSDIISLTSLVLIMTAGCQYFLFKKNVD